MCDRLRSGNLLEFLFFPLAPRLKDWSMCLELRELIFVSMCLSAKKTPLSQNLKLRFRWICIRTGQRSIKTFHFGHDIWRSNFPFSGKDKSLLRNILTTKELSVLTSSFLCNKINIANSMEKCSFFASFAPIWTSESKKPVELFLDFKVNSLLCSIFYVIVAVIVFIFLILLYWISIN